MSERQGDERMIRVAVVDRDPLVRQALCRLLARHADIQIVAEACCGAELRERVYAAAPDVVLLDHGLPELGRVDEVCRAVREGCGARVILLSLYFEQAVEALAGGAAECLCRACPPAELLSAIRQTATRLRATGAVVPRPSAVPLPS